MSLLQCVTSVTELLLNIWCFRLMVASTPGRGHILQLLHWSDWPPAAHSSESNRTIEPRSEHGRNQRRDRELVLTHQRFIHMSRLWFCMKKSGLGGGGGHTHGGRVSASQCPCLTVRRSLARVPVIWRSFWLFLSSYSFPSLQFKWMRGPGELSKVLFHPRPPFTTGLATA